MPNLDTALWTAALAAGWSMYGGQGLQLMEPAVRGVGAAVGEMAADMATDMDYADTAGAAAGSYGSAMFFAGPASPMDAVIGAAGQYLGANYPMLTMMKKEEKKDT